MKCSKVTSRALPVCYVAHAACPVTLSANAVIVFFRGKSIQIDTRRAWHDKTTALGSSVAGAAYKHAGGIILIKRIAHGICDQRKRGNT